MPSAFLYIWQVRLLLVRGGELRHAALRKEGSGRLGLTLADAAAAAAALAMYFYSHLVCSICE